MYVPDVRSLHAWVSCARVKVRSEFCTLVQRLSDRGAQVGMRGVHASAEGRVLKQARAGRLDLHNRHRTCESLPEQEVGDGLAPAVDRRPPYVRLSPDQQHRVREGDTQDERVRLEERLPGSLVRVPIEQRLEAADQLCERHTLDF